MTAPDAPHTTERLTVAQVAELSSKWDKLYDLLHPDSSQELRDWLGMAADQMEEWFATATDAEMEQLRNVEVGP